MPYPTILLPEQGQLVRVRRRPYVVTDVRPSTLTYAERPVTVVSLAAVDDDSLGEALDVIWETEIGARIIDRAELPTPDRIDPPPTLAAFLDAVRWGAASQSDHAALQAPFRSGIQLEDYQLNPLVRAVQMPRVSLLIADDVGLGKTVETGLVLQELITRNRARTALIICPAGLQYHWRDQMREKFGLDFRIVNADLMRVLRRTRGLHVNPWAHFPRLITSMDFIKRERPLRLFRESVKDRPAYPRPYDALVIDEAHNIAPSGVGQYAIDSQRTAAIREIVPFFEHHIFLSATPHNGFPESFTALLELLDNQRFARGVEPNRQQLDLVMVRRLKRDLKDEFGNPRFPPRQITPLEVAYTDAERQAHAWLRDYAALRRAHAQTGEAQYASEFIYKLLKKRLLSSPEAFRATLEAHRTTLQKARPPQGRDLAMGILRRQIAQTDEDYADDDLLEVTAQSAVTSATTLLPPLTPEEDALLCQMERWAEDAARRPDSKAARLIAWLREIVQPNGVWNNERVILFTEYRATQRWLQTMLAAAGLGDADHTALIYGGMDEKEREYIKAAFQAAPGPDNTLRILLATDAASEGIDLQNYCHRLVHVDIPWNPNRLEQRNGRIDRMGQRFPPEIYHFVPQGYQETPGERIEGRGTNTLDADLEFLARIVQKLDRMREDLSGKVGNVIAAQVEDVMRGFRREIDLAEIADRTRPAKALLRLERELNDKIQRQIQRFYDERHKLHLNGEAVQRVVETALRLSNQLPLQPAAAIPHAFYLPPLRGNAWNAAREGLIHPFTGAERPIVFDEAFAKGDQVVLAHLNHPLVLIAQRLLRAEIWSEQGKLARFTARRAPNHALSGPALAAYARLVVVGGGRYRLHEELISAGGTLTFDGARASFRRLGPEALEKALEAATDDLPSPAALTALQNTWEASNLQAALRSALDARMKDRLETIEKQLAARRDKEEADIVTILTELANAIRAELKPVDQLTLPGFSPAENEQYARDMDALRRRLERIPDEIERERQATRTRYADYQPRLFPVAVVFLVPERMG
jgi:superfamily II DNA/RNA helicase